jgi:hypothetical protein
MIEKLLPRVLNSSSDNRLKKKTEMNDAYNVVVTEDFSDFTDSTDSGNEGVLKPVKGNLAQTSVPSTLFQGAAQRRVLGSVSDARTGVVYFFVFSETASEMGVYAYDTTNYFGSGSYVYVSVYTTSEFNFQQDSVVQGDIVHVSGTEGDFRPILYFTDNVNEPRKIDVLRAREGVDYFPNTIHEKDFITACPKAPQRPITFVFEREQVAGGNNADRGSDFRRVPGFQFAYQCIYRGGEESAISTYSDIAVPPEYLRQSIYSDQISLSNVCRLTIPAVVGQVFNYSNEIDRIKILVRQGNTGAFFVVDEVPRGVAGTAAFYDFRNDRVLSGITTEEEQKQFDNLPRVAQALAVVENRLFYGNYVEGYDEPNVLANVSAQYVDRPSDFVDVDISVTPVVVPLHTLDSLEPEVLSQRVSGYVFDTSGVANDIPANTFVSVSVTINPGRSYEFYNATESYHATRLTGAGDVVASRTATYNTIDYPASDFDGGEENNYSGAGLHVFGRNLGVGGNLFWQNTEAPEGDAVLDTNVSVTIGSSPASALKFPGQSITFSAEFEVTDGTSDGKQLLLDAITAAFSEDQATPSGINLVSVNDNPFITWDHGFLDPEEAPGPLTSNLTNLSLDLPPEQLAVTAIMPKDGDLDLARLIVPVCNNENNSVSNATFGFANRVAPRGYFIVNSATAFFRLRRQSHMNLEANQAVMTLEVSSLAGVDVRTCIPVVKPTTLRVKGWRVYSGEYLNGHFITDVSETGEPEQLGSLTYIMARQAENDPLGASNDDRAAIIGYLHSENSLGVEDDDLYRTNNFLRETNNPPGSPDLQQDITGFSLVDGEAGLLVRERDRVVTDETVIDNVPFLGTFTTVTRIIEPGEGAQAIGCYGLDQMFGFAALKNEPNANQNLVSSSDNFDLLTVKERLNFNVFANQSLLNVFDFQTFLVDELIDPEQRAPFEISYNAYIDESELTGVYRSFKTHANHDFGIVYYDERGRPGNVNRLDSVYVNGYSNLERGSSKGRVEISIELQSDPPTWAHHYQIVYAGNSSVRDFIQYSTGGAFKPVNVEADETVPNKNIYVSLNYLQENALVSYSRSFGAVATDGTQNLYVFAPGDYLRIVSYYLDEDTVVYPSNQIFEIADVVNLGSEPDENPLVATGEVPPHLQGQFLVLTDNDAATGFSFADVAAGNNEVDTAAHYWNNRCVVELVSPRATVDPEERVYHEIAQVYNVGRNNSGVYHQTPTVIVRNGDVWWRRVPVNITSFDAEQGSFLNLIREDGESTQSAFRNYYLESKTFNDTFPGTDVNGFGKRKFISTVSNEVRRFSSVTFSDQNDYSTQRLRFTSFNPFNAPFKDLPNEHGNINSLLNFSDSLFVVQENKASAIPVSRNVLSDALGQDTLISTNKVIGDQVFYAGQYGSDNNPESVLKVDNSIYFAHKSRGEVYKFNPSNGIQVISQKGMNSFFRDRFQDAILQGGQIRVVSGYDPLKDEYLITISNFDNLTQPSSEQYVQPNVSLLGPPVVPTGGGTGVDGGSEPVGGVINIGTDFDAVVLGPINDLVDDLTEPNTDDVELVQIKSDIEDALNSAELTNPAFTGINTIPGSSVIDFSDPLNPSVTVDVDMSGVFSQEMADYLGDFVLSGSTSPTSTVTLGTFVAAQNRIVEFPQLVSGVPSAAFTAATFTAQASLPDPSQYFSYVDDNGNIGGILNPGDPIALRTAMEVAFNRVQDDILLLSLAYKSKESQINDLYETTKDLIDEVDSVVESLELGSEPNVAALRAATDSSYQALTNHLVNVLQIDTPGTASLISPERAATDGAYSGFGAFDLTEYPLTDSVNLNALDSVKTFFLNLAESLGALLNFNSVDLSAPLAQLLDTNAALRNQIEILTDQIQELSEATNTATLNTTLIEGVNTNQLNTETLSVLSGADQTLQESDVLRNLQNQVEFIVQNVIGQAVSDTLTVEAAKNISADIIKQVFAAAGWLDDSPVADFYDVYGIREGSRFASNPGLFAGSSTNILRTLPAIVDVFDSDASGSYSAVGDVPAPFGVLGAETLFGQPTLFSPQDRVASLLEYVRGPAEGVSEVFDELQANNFGDAQTLVKLQDFWTHINQEVPDIQPWGSTGFIFAFNTGQQGGDVYNAILEQAQTEISKAFAAGVALQTPIGSVGPPQGLDNIRSVEELDDIVSNVISTYQYNA